MAKIICKLVSGPMPSVDQVILEVNSNSCGAISVFQGVIRDQFQGKLVTHLFYECYEAMAMSKLEQISWELAKEYSDLKGLAIYHKIGEVPVGFASVTIVAVSPHSKCALEVAAITIE